MEVRESVVNLFESAVLVEFEFQAAPQFDFVSDSVFIDLDNELTRKVGLDVFGDGHKQF